MSTENMNLYRLTYRTPDSVRLGSKSVVGFSTQTVEFMAVNFEEAMEIISNMVSDQGIVETINPEIILNPHVEHLWLSVPAIAPKELVQVLRKW